MMRYCPNCGTEVDETAVFCPTCGQPIDQATETEIPPAPAWPEAPRAAAPPPPADVEPEPGPEPEPEPMVDQRTEAWPAPEPEPPAAAAPEPAPRPAQTAAPPAAAAPPPAGAGSGTNLPLTMPLTLSAWLIGGGAFVGAVGALIALFARGASPIDLLVLVVLLGVAATVFFSSSMPEIPHLRLITLAVVLVAFGVGLDRLGFGGAGIGELLLFLGTAAAAIGAVLLELGHDQPLGVAR